MVCNYLSVCSCYTCLRLLMTCDETFTPSDARTFPRLFRPRFVVLQLLIVVHWLAYQYQCSMAFYTLHRLHIQCWISQGNFRPPSFTQGHGFALELPPPMVRFEPTAGHSTGLRSRGMASVLLFRWSDCGFDPLRSESSLGRGGGGERKKSFAPLIGGEFMLWLRVVHAMFPCTSKNAFYTVKYAKLQVWGDCVGFEPVSGNHATYGVAMDAVDWEGSLNIGHRSFTCPTLQSVLSQSTKGG